MLVLDHNATPNPHALPNRARIRAFDLGRECPVPCRMLLAKIVLVAPRGSGMRRLGELLHPFRQKTNGAHFRRRRWQMA